MIALEFGLDSLPGRIREFTTYTAHGEADGDYWDESPEDVRRAVYEDRILGMLTMRARRAILRDPKLRSCDTCVHFQAKPCCDVGSDDCGCKGLNRCKAGAFLEWRHNHGPYDPDGWWKRVIDHRIMCPSWEGQPR